MDLRSSMSALLLASFALAQTPTHISPAVAATTVGYGADNKPFGEPYIAYQQVHSWNSFNNRLPTLVTQMRFRTTLLFNMPGATIDVELFMATSPNDASAASSTFANNVTGSEVNVFTRKRVLLPSLPDHRWAVAPFPFDNPFALLPTHMSWRAVVHGNLSGNTQLIYFLNAYSATLASTHNGIGCRAGNGTGFSAHYVSGGGVGLTAEYIGDSFVVSGGLPAILTMGTSNRSFHGIPLPFDLTPAGAPGCGLYNNWVALFVGATAAGPNGRATFPVPIPDDPALANTTHYSQFLFLSPAANALGVFTSQGKANAFGPAVGITSIHAIGNPGATSGILAPQSGVAIGLN
jgi:hypothetical protein